MYWTVDVDFDVYADADDYVGVVGDGGVDVDIDIDG